MTTHTPEELGCLAGGPARAAEVALARLLHAGLVRVSREGVVTAVQRPAHISPLEARILNGLRGRRYVEEVLRDAAASPEAAGLRAHLADRGLLRRRRSWRPRLYPWLYVLGIGLIAAGFVRLVFPELPQQYAPQLTGFPLWYPFAGGALVLMWATVLSARDPGRLRTRVGHRTVNRAARRVSAHDPLSAVAMLGLRGRIGRLAIAGMFGLTPVVAGMVPYRETSSSSSCGSGCSSSSCGSGDSGGGCGGGCGGGGD